jgi:hypothetical protein
MPDTMHRRIKEHITSIVFIGLVFLGIFLIRGPEMKQTTYQYLDEIKTYTQLDFLDLSDPADRTLLQEALDYRDPANAQQHERLMAEIASYMNDRITAGAYSRPTSGVPDLSKLISLLGMLVKFAAIYILVLLFTTYGVETFAMYRFVRLQQPDSTMGSITAGWNALIRAQTWNERLRHSWFVIKKTLRILLKGVVMFVLFAPAYVIAYSFKTRFDTDSILLMILLGVVSNGVLITYTQKYFTFLKAESRKGYVQTAIVKNLKKDYRFSAPDGIRPASLFRIRKEFPGHILGHIFANVRLQYLSTLKEQASFLVTGLIIIEMALNIQGHLCYELMQNILYKNLAVVLLIVFGIFVIVKLTEMVIDQIIFNQRRKIGDKV